MIELMDSNFQHKGLRMHYGLLQLIPDIHWHQTQHNIQRITHKKSSANRITYVSVVVHYLMHLLAISF